MGARDTAAAGTSPAVAADEDAPVYDERGNVRPHGTKGARPMSYDERVAIAKKLGAGEIVGDAKLGDEPDPRKVRGPRRRGRKAAGK